MTPKQQAIKKAYGDKYDTLKDQIDENGWVEHYPGKEGHPNWRDLLKDEYELQCIEGLPDYWRPASLNGLEDNRGWVSVKDRLPENVDPDRERWIDIEYWIHTKHGGIFTANWDPDKKNGEHEWFVSDWNSIPVDEVTHWQPVVRPEPPIY